MNQSPVYRQLALPVPVFDYIKNYQRAHAVRFGEHLSINQTVAAIVLSHQHNEVREEREKTNKQPALQRSN